MVAKYKHYLHALPAGLIASIFLHMFIFAAAIKWVVIPLADPSEHTQENPDDTSYYFYQPASIPTPPDKRNNNEKRAVAPNTATAAEFDLSQTALKPHLDERKRAERLFNSQKNSAIEKQEYLEPLRLIGEKLLDDPFRKLLGLAISRQLFYPPIARELFLHGTVGVGFTLFPNGDIHNIHVVKSSKERILDQAAVQAVKKASPMQNVDIYLQEPRDLTINIIY